MSSSKMRNFKWNWRGDSDKVGFIFQDSRISISSDSCD
jgi:hypothetical protein